MTVAKVTQLNGDEIPVVFVANDDTTVYAIDAINGHKLWEKRVETHEHAVITGSPVYYAGNIFIPVRGEVVVHLEGLLFLWMLCREKRTGEPTQSKNQRPLLKEIY